MAGNIQIIPVPSGLRLLLLMSVAAGLSSCSPPSAPAAKASASPAVAVTVGPAEAVSRERTLSVVGTLFAKAEAVIGAEVEGRVEKVLAEIGDRTASQQELAQVDTAAYVAQAQLAVANLAKAKVNLEHAEKNLVRVQELRKQQISAISDLDLATAQAGQWRAEVQAQEAATAIARLNLTRSYVRAPFAAAIAERLINAGDYVKAGTPLFRVVDDTELKLMVQVPEQYAGQVRLGQIIRFNVDAFPQESFEGRVYFISPAVNTSSRAFQVAALAGNPDRKLKASSFARGELVLNPAVPMVMAPLAAVQSFAGVTKVFVVEKNIARSRSVQTGKVSEGRQEILKGLTAGEVLVISGQTRLYDGASVRIRQPEKAGVPASSGTAAPEPKPAAN